MNVFESCSGQNKMCRRILNQYRNQLFCSCIFTLNLPAASILRCAPLTLLRFIRGQCKIILYYLPCLLGLCQMAIVLLFPPYFCLISLSCLFEMSLFVLILISILKQMFKKLLLDHQLPNNCLIDT